MKKAIKSIFSHEIVLMITIKFVETIFSGSSIRCLARKKAY